MSISMLREYLGKKPSYMSGTFAVNSEVDVVKTIKKKSHPPVKSRTPIHGSYDPDDDDLDDDTMLSQESDSLDADSAADVNPADSMDDLTAEDGDLSEKLGGFIELINGAYEDMGMKTVVVYGVERPVGKRSKRSQKTQFADKTASTLSDKMQRIFSKTSNKKCGGDQPDDNSVLNLITEIVQDDKAGAYELDPPEDHDTSLDILTLIKGSEDLSQEERDEEDAAGLSILEMLGE